MIKHEDGKWVLYTADGSKVLGKHDTKAEAVAQEQIIKAQKTKESQLFMDFSSLQKQFTAIDIREAGETITSEQLSVLTQIVDLCKQLITPAAAPDAILGNSTGNQPKGTAKPAPVSVTKTKEAKESENMDLVNLEESYFEGSMEALLDDIRQAIESKNVQGFCDCNATEERKDFSWGTLNLVATGIDGTCVIQCNNCDQMWKTNYGRDGEGGVTFSNIKKAKEILITTESRRFGKDVNIEEAAVSLAEGAGMDENGIIKDACIIQPGWGTTGYYDAETLKRDAPLFEGAQMFIDHPTAVEESQLPERTLTRLAGVVVGVPEYKESGWKGSGLYGPTKIFSDHRETIKEKAPYIGLSLYGTGKSRLGEVGGRKGKIIEAITKVRSVDFVTMAGAGGQLMPLLESAKDINNTTITISAVDAKSFQDSLTLDILKKQRPDIVESLRKEIKDAIYPEKLNERQVKKMADEKEVQELQALKESFEQSQTKLKALELKNLKLESKDMIREATAVVSKLVEASKLPIITKNRLNKSCVETPLTEAGELDITKLTEATKAAIVEAETEFATIVGSGKIIGMGSQNESASIKESAGKQIAEMFGDIEEKDKT